MAYNRKNYLRKVLKVQEIVLLHRKQGLFFNEIFYKYIEIQFHISKRTYDSYLGINARKELKDLEQNNPNNQQLNLF